MLGVQSSSPTVFDCGMCHNSYMLFVHAAGYPFQGSDPLTKGCLPCASAKGGKTRWEHFQGERKRKKERSLRKLLIGDIAGQLRFCGRDKFER